MKVWICMECKRIISTGDVAPPKCSIDGGCFDAKPYAVDVPHVGQAGGPGRWAPKTLLEYVNKQRTYAPDAITARALDDLAGLLLLHRPVGSNGRHGELHTPTCGCER